MRPSWVDVDLDAIAHNVGVLSSLAAPAEFCAVVKADGYGHGDIPVAVAALDAGASSLAVALVQEGARLREGGVEAPILLLSEPLEAECPAVMQWGLTPTVYTEPFIRALARTVARSDHVDSLGVHLKVDTGMHRVGAPSFEAVRLAEMIGADEHLHLDAMWTHFAVAESDPDFTVGQLAAFEQTVAEVRSRGIEVPRTHAANTAGTMMYPDARLDLVRVGIGLYGLLPGPGVGAELGLRPALSVVSSVRYLQRHPADTRPSYGRIRPLPHESTVATVPMGYADGIPRLLATSGGEVLIGGHRYPLAGTVTMDFILVDVGDAAVTEGEEVVLIGRQGGEEITADEWAENIGTINYEIVCQIGPRMPRRYGS